MTMASWPISRVAMLRLAGLASADEAAAAPPSGRGAWRP